MSKIVKIPDMFRRATASKKRASIGSGEILEEASEGKENIVSSKKIKLDEKQVEKTEINNDVKINLRDLLKCEKWSKLLDDEFKKPYIAKIERFLDSELEKKKQVFPPPHEIFTAFNLIPFDEISVVVIGQDPYHDDNQAHGLSFSVKKGVRPPPSLKNIFKELETDIDGFKKPDHGYLVGWARQGVFMLNATLTVRAHEANSHAKIGWQKFTDAVIKILSKQSEKPIVFLLWGNFAHKKGELIDSDKHIVIKTAHPSPLSARKWFGCKCFSKCNEELENNGRNPINWNDL